MVDFYADDEMWIDEAEDFIYQDLADDVLTVDEDEADFPEPLVVEEDLADMMIPGSEKMWEDQKEEQKDTNWADDGDHAKFIDYAKDKVSKIPRHTGETIPGCERAKSFLKSIDSDISKAMRSDFNGAIDESEIDDLRKNINDMMERLEKQIKKLKGSGKTASADVRMVSTAHCEKCATVSPVWHDVENNTAVCLHCEGEVAQSDESLAKTAGTPVLNVYMTPFERAIVGTMINSKVSAGRNIEETYEKLKNKYNFTPREELAIQQLVADYGYPVLKDRGLLNEEHDPASGDGVDFQTNYQA